MSQPPLHPPLGTRELASSHSRDEQRVRRCTTTKGERVLGCAKARHGTEWIRQATASKDAIRPLQ